MAETMSLWCYGKLSETRASWVVPASSSIHSSKFKQVASSPSDHATGMVGQKPPARSLPRYGFVKIGISFPLAGGLDE